MADARARGAIRILPRDNATHLWRPSAHKGAAMTKPDGTAAFVKCLPIAHFWGLWRRQLAMLRGAVSLSLGGRAGELGPPIWLTRAREGAGRRQTPLCPRRSPCPPYPPCPPCPPCPPSSPSSPSPSVPLRSHRSHRSPPFPPFPTVPHRSPPFPTVTIRLFAYSSSSSFSGWLARRARASSGTAMRTAKVRR